MAGGYILHGIFLEERDLIAHFGDRCRAHRQQEGMLIPRRKFGSSTQSSRNAKNS